MLCCRSPISERRFPHEKSSRSRCGFIDVQHIRFCSPAARSLFRPSSSFTHFVITPGTRRAPSSYAHAYRQSGADDAYPRSDVGGRMSSMHHGYRHSSVHVGPRVYVRPSLPPPPRWRYAGYYARPYGYRAVWYGYPVPYYYYRYPYGVYYRRYYASPGIHISVRL